MRLQSKIYTAILLICLIQTNFAFNTDGNHPFLSQSSWPITHQNTWNTDSSKFQGPQGKNLDFQVLVHNIADLTQYLDPISLLRTNDDKYFWASSITDVLKIRVDDNVMTTVGKYYRGIEMSYHGAYAFISSEDIYYVAGDTYIAQYSNQNKSDHESPIVLLKRLNITGLLEDEHLIGLSLTFDDHLAFVTNYGKVGVASPDFSFVSDFFQLPGQEELEHKNRMITNSFAIDKFGGIYIVTSNWMNKVIWDPKQKTIKSEWSTRYHDQEQSIYWGRFGPGSGSSPSLMGDKDGGIPEFVVISDGAQQMNVLFFKCDSGKLVGNKTVTFGDSNTVAAQSEQSVVVFGYKVVVVNNWFWDQDIPFTCHLILKMKQMSSKIVQGCPFLLGMKSNGIEQMEIDPKTYEVKSNWGNTEVSCTSSIPVVSEKGETLYCIGKRDSNFTAEAVNWKTGKSEFSLQLNAEANPFYAGTEIGTKNDLLIGTILGPLRVTEKNSNQ